MNKRTRMVIDGRSPQAKAMGIRGAHIGMNGEVLSGVNKISGLRNTVPPMTDRNPFKIRPIMGNGLDPEQGALAKASTAAMRSTASARNATRAEDAVLTEMGNQALRNSPRATPTLTDMRPEKYRGARDGNPNGALYREQEQGVIDQQRAERENTKPEDRTGEYMKRQSDSFRTTEARSRTDALMRGPDITGKLPSDTRAAVLTDPKYGGSGVGYARRAMTLPTPARLPNPSMPQLAIDAKPNATVPSRPLPTYSAAARRPMEVPSEPKEPAQPVPASPVVEGMQDSNYPKAVKYRRQNGRMRPV